MFRPTFRRQRRRFPGGRSPRSAICFGTRDQRADTVATRNIIDEHLPSLADAIDRLIVEAERRDRG